MSEWLLCFCRCDCGESVLVDDEDEREPDAIRCLDCQKGIHHHAYEEEPPVMHKRKNL